MKISDKAKATIYVWGTRIILTLAWAIVGAMIPFLPLILGIYE